MRVAAPAEDDEDEEDAQNANTEAVISTMKSMGRMSYMSTGSKRAGSRTRTDSLASGAPPKSGPPSPVKRALLGVGRGSVQARVGGPAAALTQHLKNVQVAEAAGCAFVGAAPREIWDEETSVFVELGLLASGRLFGGTNQGPSRRAATAGEAASQGAGGGPDFRVSNPGGAGAPARGASPSTAAAGLTAGAERGSLSGIGAIPSASVAGGGRRAVSAVTDTRCELFVIRREEAEVCLGAPVTTKSRLPGHALARLPHACRPGWATC